MKANRFIAAGVGVGLAMTGCGAESAPPSERFPSSEATSIGPSRGAALAGFAIGDGFFGLSDASLDGRMEAAAKHGNAVRIDFDWAMAQPNEGEAYKWEESDRIVAAARARGLAVLAMVGFAPAWARDPACATDYGCAPQSAEEFAAFAGAVADRYKDDVAHFEVWNEPNAKRFFGPRPDVARYGAMLTLASKAIKSAHPQAQVSSAGLAAGYDDGVNIAPVTFLQKLYGSGVTGFDAVALHPYNSPARPSQPFEWSAFTQIEGDPKFPAIQTIHGVMAEYGDDQKQIWLTEYGAPTAGGGNKATLADQRFDDFDERPGAYVDEGLQAKMIDEFLHHEFRAANVTVRMVHTLYDRRTAGSAPDTEDHFGIYNADGTPKKAATIFVRR